MGASYDYASNVTQRYDGLRSQWTQNTFTYDNLHRLKKGQQGNPVTITWEWDDGQTGGEALDRLGNWVNFDNAGTADARTHNVANEILSRDVDCVLKAVEYDAAGNLVKLDRDVDPQTTERLQFAYDYRNRLIRVEELNGALLTWDTRAEYFYDALNRRVKKNLTSTTDTVYLLRSPYFALQSDLHFWYNAGL